MSAMYLNALSPSSLPFFYNLKDCHRLSASFKAGDDAYVMPLNEIDSLRGGGFSDTLPTTKYPSLLKSMTGHVMSVQKGYDVSGRATALQDFPCRFVTGFVGTKSQSCRDEVTVNMDSLLRPLLNCCSQLPVDRLELQVRRKDVATSADSNRRDLRALKRLDSDVSDRAVGKKEWRAGGDAASKATAPRHLTPSSASDETTKSLSGASADKGSPEIGNETKNRCPTNAATLHSNLRQACEIGSVSGNSEDPKCVHVSDCNEAVTELPVDYSVVNKVTDIIVSDDSNECTFESEDVQTKVISDSSAEHCMPRQRKLPTFNCNILRSRLPVRASRKQTKRSQESCISRYVRGLLKTCLEINRTGDFNEDETSAPKFESSQEESSPRVVGNTFVCAELLDLSNDVPELQTPIPNWISVAEGLWPEADRDAVQAYPEMPPLAFEASSDPNVLCRNAAIAFIIGCADEISAGSDWNSDSESDDSWCGDELWDFICPLQQQSLSGFSPLNVYRDSTDGCKTDGTLAATFDDPVVPEESTCTVDGVSEFRLADKLDGVNHRWNSSMDCIDVESQKQTKVHFAPDTDLETVFVVTDWPDEYQSARMGPWEQYARDAERFRNRVRDVEPILSACLDPQHRKKVFERIQASS